MVHIRVILMKRKMDDYVIKPETEIKVIDLFRPQERPQEKTSGKDRSLLRKI